MTDPIHLSNNPPLVDKEAIALRYKSDFVASTAILNAEASLPREVKKPADLERLAKHVKDARMVSKTLDGHRATEKAVFDEAGKNVQQLFKPRLDALDQTKRYAEAIITRHNNKVAEEARIAAAAAAKAQREEADRIAAAAAAMETDNLDSVADTVMNAAVDAERMADRLDRVATGSQADLVRTSTEAGTVSSKATIVHSIEDQAALRATLGPLGAYLDIASIDKAIRAMIKADKLAGRMPNLAGVVFSEQNKAFIR